MMPSKLAYLIRGDILIRGMKHMNMVDTIIIFINCLIHLRLTRWEAIFWAKR